MTIFQFLGVLLWLNLTYLWTACTISILNCVLAMVTNGPVAHQVDLRGPRLIRLATPPGVWLRIDVGMSRAGNCRSQISPSCGRFFELWCHRFTRAAVCPSRYSVLTLSSSELTNRPFRRSCERELGSLYYAKWGGEDVSAYYVNRLSDLSALV